MTDWADRSKGARKNPTKGKSFTPSYPAATQREYDAAVARCASEVGKTWQDRLGCKRLEHVMIEGGRSESHYETGRVPVESAATSARLGGQNRPFQARTQSVKTRRAASPPRPGLVATGPELDIARAINDYRKTQAKGALGFSVPDTIGPLLRAGMPKKAARILVRRAARRFYPDVPYLSMSRVPLISRLNQAVGKLVMEGRPGFLKPYGPPYQLMIEGHQKLGYVVEISTREGNVPAKKARGGPVISAEELSELYEDYKNFIEADRPFRYEHDAPRFLHALFGKSLSLGPQVRIPGLTHRLVSLAEGWGTPSVVLELFFEPSGKEVEVPFSVGEHSKLSAFQAVPSKVDYRSLQNVSLTDLPRLLARLSRRKKRKGRQLQPLSPARTNPAMADSSDNVLLQLVFEKAYGAVPELIPVPGKPGRVYWPITKQRSVRGTKTRVPLGLKEVDEGQARSWLKIAETGRKAAPLLRETASELYALGGMSSRPLLTGPTQSPAATTAMENPMSHNDDWYFRDQFNKGPYGGSRSLPKARRNASKKRKLSPEAAAKFRAVGKRAQQIAKASGCDMSAAMKQAWADVKGMRAAANPFDNPVPGALVRSPYAWSDETEVFSALVPRSNPPHWQSKGHHPYSRFSQRLSPNYEQLVGQFSTGEQITHGMQPMNRRNPDGVMTGRFPGSCCICGGETRGTAIVKHPHMKGPRGGKKYAHVECM